MLKDNLGLAARAALYIMMRIEVKKLTVNMDGLGINRARDWQCGTLVNKVSQLWRWCK